MERKNKKYFLLRFEKNEKLFHAKFVQKLKAKANYLYNTKHQSLSIEKFNPQEKLRFYLIKAI